MYGPPDQTTPIFVRGLSRSGGTLLVTLLDAHPSIAMSYELYPTLLSRDESHIDLQLLAEQLKNAKSLNAAGKAIDHPNLRTFVLRCARGGLDHQDLARIVSDHAAQGLDLEDPNAQLTFMAQCCKTKMSKEGKSTWGLKCTSDYSSYLSHWPNAFFINIIRDGRDVLASQLNTGSFNNSATDVARSWVNTHRKFRQLIDNPEVNAHEVVYERLAYRPEEEVKRLCDFLSLPYDEGMLHYYDKDLTIFDTRHLSMDRISAPIDTQRIGRWRTDLSEQQLRDFYSVAGDMMIDLGYATSDEVDAVLA